ncbi:MAG TPA: peptidylprolyl isomerase [Bacteroidales bacterium]|nr:peptidylprolyl isomerase [Bacteroidales bacterium]
MKYLLLFITIFIPGVARSQMLLESVAAIVGNEVIYLSDIEASVADMRRSDPRLNTADLRCRMFNDMLVAKLFLDQARIDSITVTDDMVNSQIDMQMNDAVRKAGSEEALVTYFKKSILEIRRDLRKRMLEQETVNEVQRSITKDIKVTPSALRRYYSSIPKDSIPVVPAKYEMSIIQLDPPSAEESKAEARQKLLDIRSQILEGKSFNVLAIMYSEDPGSAKNGGEIGYMTRGELEKEYADVAFSLTKNTVSRIVETRHGFHIIQLIDRKGDMVNTRHILIRPKITAEQSERAIAKLDSIADQIRRDSITFEHAAMRFSTHKDSRMNGGKYVSSNPSERITWFALEDLNPDIYTRIRDMNVGEISEPFRTLDENNKEVFRIVRLDNILPAHSANLKDDYQSIYNAAWAEERSKVLKKWIDNKIKTTYIKISDEYKTCDFLKEGWLK